MHAHRGYRFSFRSLLLGAVLVLPVSCSSGEVMRGGPVKAPPATLPADCPHVASSAPKAVVDYVDAIEANGIQYVAQHGVTVAPGDVGAVQFRVRCSFAQLNLVTGRETPNLRNGDATFLFPDTPVHAIRGWSPLCRLAAPNDGSWKIYFALLNGTAVATVSPCAKNEASSG
jgi:hypothetical protein